MAPGVPVVLATLLSSTDPRERDRSWETFVEQHSRLILHAIRSCGGSHDAVMDRYAFVLEQLRADDYRRLRTWAGDGRSQLSTWLVVVVKRLCHDHHRSHYGRHRPEAGNGAREARVQRRKLADLVADELKPDQISAGDGVAHHPEMALRTADLNGALHHAVEQLAAGDQLLLTLRFRDELSAAQIARQVGLPTPFHVYRRLNHLLLALRRNLAARGIEDATP